MSPTTTVVPPTPPLFDEARLAVAGFLARYSGTTRTSYATDLRQWFAWCAQVGLEVFSARRAHIELCARAWRTGPGPGHHRPAAVDRRRLLPLRRHRRRHRALAGRVRPTTQDRHRVDHPRPRPHGARRLHRPGRRRRRVDHALACLLGLLGLRVSEALNIDIEHLAIERGHRTVTVLGKGSKLAVDPAAAQGGTGRRPGRRRALERAGAAVRSGERLDRHAATRIVRRLAKRAGITKHISPHSLRHSFITAALDAGVPLRDVQIAARHADPRTTTRYDRARNNLDRHASYVVTAFIAGAS